MPRYLKSSFHLQVIILLCGFFCNVAQSDSAPDIKLDGWSTTDDFQKWMTNLTDIPLGFQNKSVYVVTSSVGGLSLICNASYPIEWTFHRERWGGRRVLQTMLSSQRGVDPQTLQPLWFSLEIRLLGYNTEITGNYTCQKYGQSDVSNSVYVYWEGSSPPFLSLISSGTDRRQIIYDSKRSNSFRLPCTVSRPDISVDLFWTSKTTNKTVALHTSDSGVSFHTAVGYTLTNIPDPYGVYRCTVGDIADEDSLEFEVIQGENKPHGEFDDQIWGTASFTYDAAKKQFVCCSSSSKPPKVAHYYCSHPITCQLQKHALHKVESSGRKAIKGNCTMIPLRWIANGVLRCKGDSLDIVREYFFPITKNYHDRSENITAQPFYSWTDGMKDQMMTISKVPEPLYIGEKKLITCSASPFYYAQGIHWVLYYENETIYVKGNQTNIRKRHSIGILFQGNKAKLQIVIEKGLKRIMCKAPVWNTTGWGDKTIDVTIATPEVPTILDSSYEELTWIANDTNKLLTCRSKGSPPPLITWKKDNKTQFQYIKTNRTTNSTTVVSVLRIPRVGLDSHATYTCRVSNFAGSASKVFKVYVSTGTSAEIVALYVFAVICVIVAGIAAFFGIRKMREQKEAIRRLANVAFKDVTDGLPTATNQQTYQRPNNSDIQPTPIIPIPAQTTHNGNGAANNGGGIMNGFFNDANNSEAVNDFGRYQKM